MDRLSTVPIRIGEWRVDPVSSQLSQGADIVKVEARTMRLLLFLAERTGEVVSIDELLERVWSGVVVTPDSVYQAIASLRRQLGDDPKNPRYIATVPRLGYRMVADVTPYADAPVMPVNPARRSASKLLWFGAAGAALVLMALAYWAIGFKPAEVQPTIAVLPFQDLTTQEMNEGVFADGLTEELIGALSKGGSLRVSSPTAVFYFKDKTLPVRDIARQLGVAYILDGSVRKSGNSYRVATRLIRGDTGFVMKSDSYDRPLGDLLQVQKEVASEETKAVLGALTAANKN